MRSLRNKNLIGNTRVISRSGDNFSMMTYSTTVTVANGATTGKEAAIGIPANFTPLAVQITVTTASTNAVNLQDIGDDADTDSFVDGITVALNTTGYKGMFGCNGVRGLGTGTGGALVTPDEVEVVVSGDPGATGATMRLTFLGFTS
jgi:hypothetical protein